MVAPEAASQISRVNRLPPPITWLCFTPPFLSLGVSCDVLLVFWITDPKAECLSGYLFMSGPAFCLPMSSSLPSCRLCSTVKQAQRSLNEMQTMLCKCVYVNMASNAWMYDKQCEIMTRFEDVFGCSFTEGSGWIRAWIYVCAHSCVSKVGKISKWTHMCVCGLGHTYFTFVCLYPAASVWMKSSYRPEACSPPFSPWLQPSCF